MDVRNGRSLSVANSFHQIPISEKTSNRLSIQTPWGLVRPIFVPEGIGPASGILQKCVMDTKFLRQEC